jgi:DNA-binding PadR family transcriptional regulator
MLQHIMQPFGCMSKPITLCTFFSTPKIDNRTQAITISNIDISSAVVVMSKKESEQVPDANNWLPLTPAVFHIMLALAQHECHGYGIMLEVEKLTQGQMRLGPGTLYRSIQRMVVDGLLEERKETAESDDDRDDERRRYYRLTKLGLQVAQAEAARLAQLVKAARQNGLLS